MNALRNRWLLVGCVGALFAAIVGWAVGSGGLLSEGVMGGELLGALLLVLLEAPQHRRALLCVLPLAALQLLQLL